MKEINKIPKSFDHKWYRDEFVQTGANYDDLDEVEKYDKRMGEFRDINGENEVIQSLLHLNSSHTLIEIGCGTSNFSIFAAKLSKQVYAIDISKGMIEYSIVKAKKAGIENIKFSRGGFLSYEHKEDPVDFVVSSLALHHLNDFWKQISILRLNQMLKMGGSVLLQDVVFGFPAEEFETEIPTWFDNTGDQETNDNFANHIANEDSTFDWILEEMFVKAGFELEKKIKDPDFLSKYVYKKVRNT